MVERKSSAPQPGESHNDRRRTQRVYISMRVRIRGKVGTQNFQEETQTASVNGYGGMVRLKQPVARGQEVLMFNPATEEEVPCTVTYVGQKDRGKTEVGVEFVAPSPRFWKITFPPSDWDPAERKRPDEVRK